MLMKDDDRKKMAIIISSKNPDKIIQKDEISDNRIALLSAAQEILSAIKLDDSKMLYESLCSLIDMHQEYKEEMEED